MDDTADEDVAVPDELAPRRARHRIEHIFSKHKIPGRIDGDLFCFEFAELVARVEVAKGSRPDTVHAHMTVSGPVVAKPVVPAEWLLLRIGSAT